MSQRVLKGDHVTFVGEFIFIDEFEMVGGPSESFSSVQCHAVVTDRSESLGSTGR